MRKFLAAAIACAAILLGACSTLQNLDAAIQLTTKSVSNPVTSTDLYEVESGVQIAFTALNAYRKSCLQGLVDKNCRANITAVQAYTTQLSPLLAQLRSFVRNNDQINATVIYNQIVALVANFKTAARNVGINVGG